MRYNMKFAIRDDDTSYFTDVTELKKAFSEIKDIPISLSVIPEAKCNHGDVYPYGNGPFDSEYGKLGDNVALVSYLKENMIAGNFEILMHGIHHEYFQIGSEWVPETLLFDYDEAVNFISLNRRYLSELFETNIDIFVAPSNSFNKDVYKALDHLGMDTMCKLSKYVDHYYSCYFLYHYLRRNYYCAIGKFDNYGVKKYRNHKEVDMYPFESFDKSWKTYELCKQRNIPYIFYTHYWEINNSKSMKEELTQLVSKMVNDGAKPSFVSECFK